MKYVEDDSTMFWAIGPDSGVIAKHAAFCGNEVEIVVPFEGVHSGEVTVLSFMPGFCIYYYSITCFLVSNKICMFNFAPYFMQLTVKLVLKEWQFSDGSHVLDNFSSHSSLFGSSNFLPQTGRKVNITVVEGKDLITKDRSGKCSPYVKLQYGKVDILLPALCSLVSHWYTLCKNWWILLMSGYFLFRFSREQGLLML